MGKTFKLTINDRSYLVEVGDLGRAPVEVRVDGKVFHVEVEGNAEKGPVPVMSIASAHAAPSGMPSPKAKSASERLASAESKALTAPMPGVVLAVMVEVGTRVKRGEEVCTMESMKMELNILANADGVVKEVLVSTGQAVAHGAALVRFE